MSQSLRPDESGSSERNRNQIRRVRGGSEGFVSVLLCPLPSRLDRRREESVSFEQMENFSADRRHVLLFRANRQ